MMHQVTRESCGSTGWAFDADEERQPNASEDESVEDGDDEELDEDCGRCEIRVAAAGLADVVSSHHGVCERVSVYYEERL